MTTNNLLVDDGPRWHLFIRQETTDVDMLNKAAWNLKSGRSGIVHRHAANEGCNEDCDYLEPEAGDE